MRGKTHVTVPGKKLETNLELVRLDTDFWKSRLHERSELASRSAGRVLAVSRCDRALLPLARVEKRIVKPSGQPEWVQISKHNHFLDCEAMNEAAGHLLAAHKIPVGTVRESGDGANIVDVKRATAVANLLAQ